MIDLYLALNANDVSIQLLPSLIITKTETDFGIVGNQGTVWRS